MFIISNEHKFIGKMYFIHHSDIEHIYMNEQNNISWNVSLINEIKHSTWKFVTLNTKGYSNVSYYSHTLIYDMFMFNYR